MCSIFGVESKSIPVETLREHFDRTLSRGPDMSRLTEIPCGYLGFHRLAVACPIGQPGHTPAKRCLLGVRGLRGRSMLCLGLRILIGGTLSWRILS